MLSEEEVVVDKQVVPKERVRLGKETVTTDQEVTEEVRKERIETDGDVSSQLARTPAAASRNRRIEPKGTHMPDPTQEKTESQAPGAPSSTSITNRATSRWRARTARPRSPTASSPRSPASPPAKSPACMNSVAAPLARSAP